MYLCYIDESGTSDIPGNTSHFVLCGLSIPIWKWKNCEKIIHNIKKKYHLENEEIHTGWIIRNYTEQNKIPKFEELSYEIRRYEVEKIRKQSVLDLEKSRDSKALKQVKKNYTKTAAYVHLSYNERKAFVKEIAVEIGGWSYARLFAECIDKLYFNPKHTSVHNTVDAQCFEQIVSRFEIFLEHQDICNKRQTKKYSLKKNYGLIIHDNNNTIAKKHTMLMKQYHRIGTFWTRIPNIIETPLFVNSELTAMVQLADLCAYSIRRYLENDETELFNEIFKRADRKDQTVVGVRHFTIEDCNCEICQHHRNNNSTGC